MFNVIKNKGNVVRAYQLGRDSAIINELIAGGKIENLGDGNYAVHSQEAVNGNAEKWLKLAIGSKSIAAAVLTRMIRSILRRIIVI